MPAGCPACGSATATAGICNACSKNVHSIEPPYCSICGRPFASRKGISHICSDCLHGKNKFVKSRAVFEYNGTIAGLIQQFKFHDRVDLSSLFVSGLVHAYTRDFDGDGISAVIPVPLSVKRLRKRSYNQTKVLADALSGKLAIPCFPRLLEKIKETPPQSTLNAAMRHENVRNAYRAHEARFLKGKKVLLVDDVITTGATINACTSALRRAGVRQVFVLALAMRV